MGVYRARKLIYKRLRLIRGMVSCGIFLQRIRLCEQTKFLYELLSELSKSDWISVDEELPPFGEEVLVRDMNAKCKSWSKPWICYRSKDECYRHITDKHKFVTTYVGEITHWKHIEK
mgnify:CR=1 FL=1